MVEDILLWRESISTLPDHHFFEIMRMYLGEIKTPYNKQKLIEDLSSFLRKDENKKNMMRLLSEEDLEILTAIKYIPKVSVEKLAKFFSKSFQFANLYEHLMNLEERLLVFRYVEKQTGKTYFKLNPLLSDYFNFLLVKENLFKPAVAENSFDLGTEKKTSSSGVTFKPELLAAIIAFVAQYPDLCKADGAFKKRIETILPTIFPQVKKVNTLKYLVSAFENLNLFRTTEAGYVISVARLKAFAKLPEIVQYAYLTSASCGHYPRDVLQKQTQLLLDMLVTVPKTGFTKETILRTMFLANEKITGFSGSMTSTGRFASMMRENQGQLANTSGTITSEDLLNKAVAFGLLIKKGKTEDGHSIYVASGIQDINYSKTEETLTEDNSRKLVSIDSGYRSE